MNDDDNDDDGGMDIIMVVIDKKMKDHTKKSDTNTISRNYRYSRNP